MWKGTYTLPHSLNKNMKNKYYSIVVLIAIILAVCSCNSNKRTKEDAMRKSNVVRDSTIYVQLNACDSDSVSVYDYRVKCKYRFAYKDARWNGNVSGSLTVGDTLAIVPSFKNKTVRYSVNLSELMGLWFFNNNSEGIRLTIDGGASSVNSSKYTMRSWDLYNGKFIFKYIPSDGSTYKEISDTSKIELLNRKNFKFTFMKQPVTCNHVTLLKRSDIKK